MVASARSQTVNPAEPDPSVWLKQIYALYQKAQKNEALQAQGNHRTRRDARLQGASRSVSARRRLREEESRRLRARLGFRDRWPGLRISQVKVGPTEIAGDKASVTVSFVNMKTPCVNVYSFVKEGGVWKVDDIETRPKGQEPTRIAKMLRESKDY